MSESGIAIEYQYTPADLDALTRELPPASPTRHRWWLYVLLMVAVLVGARPGGCLRQLVSTKADDPSAETTSRFWPWVIVFLVIWVFTFFNLRRRWGDLPDVRSLTAHRHRVEFGDEGVRMLSDPADATRSYSAFTGGTRTATFLVLWQKARPVVAIPRHVLGIDGFRRVTGDLDAKLA